MLFSLTESEVGYRLVSILICALEPIMATERYYVLPMASCGLAWYSYYLLVYFHNI